MDVPRALLAQDYDAQRDIVVEVFRNKGYGPAHRDELHKLQRVARQLHDAERAAGLPIGSTRNGG